MATSNAPAGGKYRNVEHAGQCTLEVYAGSFPDTNDSWMIPPLFVTRYPEPVDENTGEVLKTSRTLTRKEENRLMGVSRNASGEDVEYQVYKLFERLVKLRNDPPILVLRNWVIQDFRADVLMLELGINFDGVLTEHEIDAVVLVKDVGLVIVGVKRQHTEKQYARTEKQLMNAHAFFDRLMYFISGSEIKLPVITVIIFPEEKSASPTFKSDHVSYILHKDVLANFPQKWNKIMSDLLASKGNIHFSSEEFLRLARLSTGLWSMEKYQKRFYKFNSHEASTSFVVQQTDSMLRKGIFTSDLRTARNESKVIQPITDVELCRPGEGFPECKGLDFIYMTPDQKNLYQNVPQAIIRASAGAGKTFVSNMKIVDILQNHSNKSILIIAPHPHHLRLEQFVKLNGGKTIVTETFPPTDQNGNVVIITLTNFFDVHRRVLQSYYISNYHVLIDDFQSLYFSLVSSRTTFDDVVKFIERSSANVLGTDLTFWCAVDMGQSIGIDLDNSRITHLFNVNKATPRHLKIPVFNLTKSLRSSVEVSAVAKRIREMRIADQNASTTVLINSSVGHRIRAETVTYHKIIDWTPTDDHEADWKNHAIGFAVERAEEELSHLLLKPGTNTMTATNTMTLSNIALLYDDDKVVDPIKTMLRSTYRIVPQTIEEQILTNNDTIILDSTKNVASFECTCVLYLTTDTSPGDSNHYNAMTRARVRLVIVDIDYKKRRPLITDEVILIEWEEKDEEFLKH